MIKKKYPSHGYPIFLWVSALFFPLAKLFLCTTAISLVPKGFVPRIGYITILIAFVMVINTPSSLSSLSSTSLALPRSTSSSTLSPSSSSSSSSSTSSSTSSQSQKLVFIYTCVYLLYIPDNSSALGSLHFLHCIFQL